MGFIELFLKNNPIDITKEDIETFISRKIEENLNLDYKDIRAYSDFDELSKHVSAFANSAGGLLILGVSEERVGTGKNLKIFPKEITWGDETLSKEKLEDNLIAKIQPRINDLAIVPVRQRKDSLKVLFLIDVPQSDNPPHMASDNRYYKRLNFRRMLMEHYEVSDFFGKRRNPALSLLIQLTEVKAQNSTCHFQLRFILTNKGKAIAKHALLSASFHNLEIIRTSAALRSESTSRIDHLRGGTPSIQYNSSGKVFFPDPAPQTSIGGITFKVIDIHTPIRIEYQLVAEDMNVLIDQIKFPVNMIMNEGKFMIEQGRQPLILKKNHEIMLQ